MAGAAARDAEASQATRLLRTIRRSGWAGATTAEAATIDRSSPVPLYVQIRRRLLALIAGWPDPARRFYTDEELCRLFGVARMTVRAAIREFVDEGLLVRARGAGTFVAFSKVDEHFSPKMDFIDQWAMRGQPLSLAVRRFERVPAPPAFAEALAIAAGAPVLFIERLRTASFVPVSIDYRYIIEDAARTFTADGAAQQSLLDLLKQTAELDHAEMTIEAAVAEGEIAEALELMPGDPVLLRALVYYDTGRRAVMAGVSYYRSDHTGYSIRIPLKAGAGSQGDDDAVGGADVSAPSWGQLVHLR